MDSRRDSSAVILLPITPRPNMSPRWGFKTFGYPVVYKHAAPLGLNTSTLPCACALNYLLIRVDCRQFAEGFLCGDSIAYHASP